MGYTAKVDRELCVGAGACIETAPKAFGFDDEHIAVVLPGAEEESDGKLLEVARECPATAILLYKGGEEVDMLYVHPAAAGRGVGSMLVDALEKLAAARGAARLTAEVSDSAETFFRRRGFVPRQRNTVPVGGEWLANTTMEKQLAAKERPQ